MAGADLRLLAELQGLRTYRRELIPPCPARAGDIRRALREFLEYHAGGRGPLHALGFLDALGARPSSRDREQVAAVRADRKGPTGEDRGVSE